MNRRLVDKCWFLEMPASAKAVLMAMVYDADKDGEFVPDVKRLIAMTCLEKTAVYERVKWLEENGFIAGFRVPGEPTRFVVNTGKIPPNGKEKRAVITKVADTSDGFRQFWAVYPNTGRKVNLGKCWSVWQARQLEPLADEIAAHVAGMAQSAQWKAGYEPATITYLNESRWNDPVPVVTVRNEARAYLEGTLDGKRSTKTPDSDAGALWKRIPT